MRWINRPIARTLGPSEGTGLTTSNASILIIRRDILVTMKSFGGLLRIPSRVPRSRLTEYFMLRLRALVSNLDTLIVVMMSQMDT